MSSPSVSRPTLVAVDLQASINPAVFPDDNTLHDPSLILQLPSQAAINALRPKPHFDATLGKLNPPRILLRPHHVELLTNSRSSLFGHTFSRNSFRVYGQPQLHSRHCLPSLYCRVTSTPTASQLGICLSVRCVRCPQVELWGIGKSTTMFVAEYFFSLAGGLVITISGQPQPVTCPVIPA